VSADPPVTFVLGTGRCGSTLVHEVLARHPAYGWVSNIDNLLRRGSGKLNRTLYQRVPPAFTEKGRARFAPSEAYELLAAEVSPMLGDPARDLRADDLTPWLRDRLRRFFLARAAAQDAPHFLHKFTGWPRVGLLQAAFPEARFVHVVRDGRAVASSWVQMPWWRGHLGPTGWHFGPLPPALAEEWEASGRSFTLLAGLAWKLLVDAYEDARALVPAERWLELRYEDVCRRPGESFARLVAFTDVAPDAGFDRAVARHTFRVDTPQRTVDALGEPAYARLTRSLAAHLARFGYEA
jgi:hypothetical protein